MWRWWCVLAAVMTAGLACGQQVLTSRVSSVALFKNGYGCVVREVALPAGDRESVIADVPVPVHGTFWVLTPANVVLKSLTAAEGDKARTVPAITLLELLKANVGERIEVKTQDGWTAGTLLSLAENRVEKDAAPPEIPSDSRYRYGYYYEAYRPNMPPTPEQANLLILRTDQGPLALPASSVTQVRKAPGMGELKTAVTKSAPGAVLRLRTAGRGGTAQIVYLTRGITWAPSYRLNLAEQTAQLSAKAVLVNDAEDIDTPELACTAGFPNVKFAQAVDPLALKGTVAQFLASLQQPADASTRPSVMSQVVMNNAAYASAGEPDVAVPTTGTGEDLHFYRFKDIKLGRGERAYVPMFEQRMAYTDVYRWDARDLSGNRRYNREEELPQYEDVWHAVRLKNPSTLAWTTAPVMITDGDRFLGQDILYYTSPGGTALVNINKAVDVKAKMKEDTLGDRGNIRINNSTYTMYDVAGTLTVTNHKPEPLHLVINKQLTGDLRESSVPPASDTEEPRENAINARRTVVWEIDVPAGGTATVNYTYRINR